MQSKSLFRSTLRLQWPAYRIIQNEHKAFIYVLWHVNAHRALDVICILVSWNVQNVGKSPPSYMASQPLKTVILQHGIIFSILSEDV
jgi:hypothetical protein